MLWSPPSIRYLELSLIATFVSKYLIDGGDHNILQNQFIYRSGVAFLSGWLQSADVSPDDGLAAAFQEVVLNPSSPAEISLCHCFGIIILESVAVIEGYRNIHSVRGRWRRRRRAVEVREEYHVTGDSIEERARVCSLLY